MTALIEMTGIGKAFGGVSVLSDVSLRIGQGKVVALLGANGAGKSTLMKILSGNYTRDAGAIAFVRNILLAFLPAAVIGFVLIDAFEAMLSSPMTVAIAAMPLAKKSNLKVKSLKQILALTGGVTSRIFSLVKDLSIDAIVTGEECITDEAIAKWTPVWSRHANAQRRLEKARA